MIRTLVDSDTGKRAWYCSETGRVFGFLFKDAEEEQRFKSWLAAKTDESLGEMSDFACGYQWTQFVGSA